MLFICKIFVDIIYINSLSNNFFYWKVLKISWIRFFLQNKERIPNQNFWMSIGCNLPLLICRPIQSSKNFQSPQLIPSQPCTCLSKFSSFYSLSFHHIRTTHVALHYTLQEINSSMTLLHEISFKI